MTTPKITIHNVETGEIETREMNAEELAQREEQRMTDANAEAAKAAERQAILDRLGLTAEEAQLLLGGTN